MPGRELEPIGRSGPVLTEVAGEMREVFAHAGLGESAGDPRRPAAVSALRPTRGGGGMTTLLMAAAAAGLAGLGAGAFVLRAPAARPPAEAADTHAAQVVPVQPAPGQVQAPVALALSQAAPPLADTPPTRSAVRPATAAPVQRAAGAPARPTSRIALAKAHARRRESLAMAQPASCEHNASGAGCRRAVIQADRHLRAVYESAVRRGVSHAVLVDYRDRWADLRESSTDDPVRLIESYGALAYDLGRESRDQEERGERRRSSSGWKSIADAFRPMPLR